MAASVASPDLVPQRPGCTLSNLPPISRSAAAAFSRGPGEHARVLDCLPVPAAGGLSRQGPGGPNPLSVSTPAARPLSSQVKSIAPLSASRHPSQFTEALGHAASEPPARVSAPPASTVTTWWPFRPEARTHHDPASRPRIGAHQVCPAECHGPIAIPPAGPAPGPCALYRATECSWIRSRPRPASPALANTSVPHGCNRAAVSLAPSESVPRGTRAVSPPREVSRALQRRAHPAFKPTRATSDPAQRV